MKLLILSVCLLLYIHLSAQNAFYDAQKIIRFKANYDTLKEDSAIITAIPYFWEENKTFAFNRFFKLMEKLGLEKRAAMYLYKASANKFITICYTLANKLDSGPVKSLAKGYIEGLDSLNNLLPSKSQTITIIETNRQNLNAARDSFQWVNDQREQIKNDSNFIVLNSLLTVRQTAIISDTAKYSSVIKRQQENLRNLDAIENSLKNKVASLEKRISDTLSNPSSKVTSVLNTLGIARNGFKQTNSPDIDYAANILPLKEKTDAVATVSETTTATNFKMPTQSEMIDALAIYIGRRFKQEVAITLISEIRKALNKQPLLIQLFPETVKLFNDGEDFEIPRFGKMWNYAISTDFVKMPSNICRSPYVADLIRWHGSPEQFNVFHDVVTISEQVMAKNSLPDIVSLYKTDPDNIQSMLCKKSLEMLYLINSELYNTDNKDTYWLPWDRMNKMSPDEYDAFLVLIEGKYEPFFRNFNIAPPSAWSGSAGAKKLVFKNYLTKALLLLNNFQRTQKQYLDRISKDPSAPFIGVNFWDFQNELFGVIVNKDILNLSDHTDNLTTVFRKGTEIYRLLEEKNYASMVRQSMSVLEYLTPSAANDLSSLLIKSWKLEKGRLADVGQNLKDGLGRKFNQQLNIDSLHTLFSRTRDSGIIKYASSVSGRIYDSLLQQKLHCKSIFPWKEHVNKRLLAVKNKERFTALVSTLVANGNIGLSSSLSKSRFLYVTKTAEFFTDLMSAGDSKKLASVIEAYALPPNSYKIKRSSRYSIDLNAYVGAYVGAESAKYADSTTGKGVKNKFAGVYGLSVPIGITFSWGSRRKIYKNTTQTCFINRKGNIKTLSGNSFSLGISIIDIAAVVSYRVEKGENIALPQELKWAQVLSPGLHARWGIKGTPLNVSAGLQYTPQLRNLDKSENLQQTWRAYTGLFFDLPLFNVYRR